MTDAPRPKNPAGFWVIWSTVALDLVGFGIVLPLLPLYAKEFGAHPFTAAALVASFSAAQFVAAPLWGRLSDRVGRKPAFVAALIGTAVGYLITAAANGVGLLFVGRVIDGLSGSSYVVAQAAVSDTTDPVERPRLFGLLGAAFGLGFVAGPVLGGVAFVIGGRRAPFVLAACLAGANALAAVIRVPETRVDGPRAPQGGRTGRLGSLPSGFRRLVAVALVTTMAFSGFESTFALLVDRRLDASNNVVYWLFAAIGVAIVLVQVRLIGVVSARFPVEAVLRGAAVLLAVGFVLLALQGRWLLLTASLFFLVCGQGLLGPMLAAASSNAAPPEARGHALGVQQSAVALGRIIGPIVAGALFGHAGIGWPYAVAAALALAAWTLVPRRVATGRPGSQPSTGQ